MEAFLNDYKIFEKASTIFCKLLIFFPKVK